MLPKASVRWEWAHWQTQKCKLFENKQFPQFHWNYHHDLECATTTSNYFNNDKRSQDIRMSMTDNTIPAMVIIVLETIPWLNQSSRWSILRGRMVVSMWGPLQRSARWQVSHSTTCNTMPASCFLPRGAQDDFTMQCVLIYVCVCVCVCVCWITFCVKWSPWMTHCCLYWPCQHQGKCLIKSQCR